MPRVVAAVALLLAAYGSAGAQGANQELLCPPDEPTMSPSRYLRSLSLDLRGQVPEEAELTALAEAPEDQIGAFIDAWLYEPAFVERVVRHHRGLLWNNVRNVTLLNANTSLARSPEGLYWRRTLASFYRGQTIQCLDEPAQYLPDGSIRTTLVDGARREGWVEVRPYWAPERVLRVCAFDAQAAEVTASGTDCSTTAGYRDPGCGCGAELRWCNGDGASFEVLESFAEAQDLLIGGLIAEDRPYTELFTTRRAFVNGPLVHFWRHLTGVGAGLSLQPAPLDPAALPDLAFTDRERWVEIELPEAHAGILTQAAFLLRFQTNRARANRFYDAFLCQPFQPPAQGLPAPDADCSREPDLQERCGCKYCHALLEPAGSYWGRWTEQGIGYLAPQGFPRERQDCETCALTGQQCSDDCRRFYVTQAIAPEEEPYLGTLRAYYFRRDDHVRNVENGPELLALSAVADNRLPACVVRRTAEWMLGRAPLGEEQAWLTDLTREFVAGGYNFRELVRAFVQSPVYRRVR